MQLFSKYEIQQKKNNPHLYIYWKDQFSSPHKILIRFDAHAHKFCTFFIHSRINAHTHTHTVRRFTVASLRGDHQQACNCFTLADTLKCHRASFRGRDDSFVFNQRCISNVYWSVYISKLSTSKHTSIHTHLPNAANWVPVKKKNYNDFMHCTMHCSVHLSSRKFSYCLYRNTAW